MGQPGIYALAPEIEGVENVSFNDFTMGVHTTGLKQANNTFQWIDNFSKVAGKHTVKIGGEFHFDQINVNADTVDNGSFLFTGSETGLDFADFLLGIPSNYNQAQARAFYYRNKYTGLYCQDTWQLRPSLTLSYGLRWDVLPPWNEKFNQLQTLVLGEQSRVYPGAPEDLSFRAIQEFREH
jgi:outer membrane receptor for ferrienterochelin and colicin